MALTVHHLHVAQSERIVWLCEELQIPYDLKLYTRDPYFSPPAIKELVPLGQAPIIQDGDLTLTESAACVEYIIQVHGKGRLSLKPGDKEYAQYLYWFHFANGTFQGHLLTTLQVTRTGAKGGYADTLFERLRKMLSLMDERLAEHEYLAGEFTAADIMIVFSLTTMRAFFQYDLSEYKNILGYLKTVTAREGYQKARSKADSDLELMIDGPPPKSFAERLKEAGKL